MIGAYTIHRLFECRITGSVLAEVSFEYKDGPKAMLHPFSNIANASKYIEKEARDWFLSSLEDYVNHKKVIITAGNHSDKTGNLQICLTAYNSFCGKETRKITSNFLKGFEHFRAILPNENNDSYESSLHNLTELKTFCEAFLKIFPCES